MGRIRARGQRLEIIPGGGGRSSLKSANRLLQAALNGDRDHPATPRTPEELAAEARDAVAAGARSVHLHPYDGHGRQTLEAGPCAVALRAVRAACPGIPVSLSTSAAIEPDPERRRALVASWTVLPDLVTANQGEEGILKLCELLVAGGRRGRGWPAVARRRARLRRLGDSAVLRKGAGRALGPRFP